MGDCDSAIISCLPDRPVGRLTGSPKAIAMMQRGNWRVVARPPTDLGFLLFPQQGQARSGDAESERSDRNEVERCRLEGMSLC